MKRRSAFALVATLALFAAMAFEGTVLETAKSFVAARSMSNGKIAFSEPSESGRFYGIPSNLYVIDPSGVGMSRVDGGQEGFARETGGQLFQNTNDLRGTVDRILRESASFYLVERPFMRWGAARRRAS